MNPAIEMPMLEEEEYLVEPEEWTEGAAEELANRLEIELGDDQWYVIRFTRGLYEEHRWPQTLVMSSRTWKSATPTKALAGYSKCFPTDM